MGTTTPRAQDHIVVATAAAAGAFSEPGTIVSAIMMPLDAGQGLTPAAAATNAETFARMASGRPEASLSFACPGFDGDPRALPDIPEAKAFIRDFAHALGRLDLDRSIRRRLDSDTRVLVGLCTDTIPRDAVEFMSDPGVGNRQQRRRAVAASRKGRSRASS